MEKLLLYDNRIYVTREIDQGLWITYRYRRMTKLAWFGSVLASLAMMVGLAWLIKNEVPQLYRDCLAIYRKHEAAG